MKWKCSYKIRHYFFCLHTGLVFKERETYNEGMEKSKCQHGPEIWPLLIKQKRMGGEKEDWKEKKKIIGATKGGSGPQVKASLAFDNKQWVNQGGGKIQGGNKDMMVDEVSGDAEKSKLAKMKGAKARERQFSLWKM